MIQGAYRRVHHCVKVFFLHIQVILTSSICFHARRERLPVYATLALGNPLAAGQQLTAGSSLRSRNLRLKPAIETCLLLWLELYEL